MRLSAGHALSMGDCGLIKGLAWRAQPHAQKSRMKPLHGDRAYIALTEKVMVT